MTREQLEAAYPWSDRPNSRGIQRRRIDGIENYLDIGGDRISARAAAERLGVSKRTVVRWRGVLRAIGGTP
jgi:transposase